MVYIEQIYMSDLYFVQKKTINMQPYFKCKCHVMNVFAINNKISDQEALAKKWCSLHLSLSFQRDSLPKNENVIIY